MNWWVVLFEMLGLSLLGFLYYSYQKKRILRDFELDLDFVIDEVLLLLNEQLEKESFPYLKQMEIRLDQLKLDRKSFFTEDEIQKFLAEPANSEDLNDAVSHHKNILINRFEKKQK